jgi:hypothetical protein
MIQMHFQSNQIIIFSLKYEWCVNLGKSSKLKYFFPFGHSMKKLIIIEIDFCKNICNKQHINFNLIITPVVSCQMKWLDGKGNTLSPFNPRFKLC